MDMVSVIFLHLGSLVRGRVRVEEEGGDHCSATTVSLLQPRIPTVLLAAERQLVQSVHLNFSFTRVAGDQDPGADMAGAVAPKRQDTRKFFENLSGAGKSIAVLTSGGDAQGNVGVVPLSDTSVVAPVTDSGAVVCLHTVGLIILRMFADISCQLLVLG